jgi:hypothetical protein
MLSLLASVNKLKSTVDLGFAQLVTNPSDAVKTLLPIVQAVEAEAKSLTATDQHYIADLIGVISKLTAVIAATGIRANAGAKPAVASPLVSSAPLAAQAVPAMKSPVVPVASATPVVSPAPAAAPAAPDVAKPEPALPTLAPIVTLPIAPASVAAVAVPAAK